MNTSTFKKIIATFLAILLVAGVVAPLAGPLAVAIVDEIPDAAFPDPNFRAEVRRILGLKEHYEPILAGEVAKIPTLDLSNQNISNLAGIEHFTNLEELNASGNNIRLYYPHTTLGNLPHLKTLDLSGNRMTHLNLRGLPALEVLNLNNNAINSITFDTHPNLATLDLSRNRLTTIPFGTHPSLGTLNLSGNMLTTLDVSGAPVLQDLDASRNSLTDITLGTHSHMHYLNVSSNQLTTLDVSGLTALRGLRAWRNRLTTLDVSNLRELWYLDVQRNYFNAIARIVGLGNTNITLIMEGEGMVVGDDRIERGFFFHPQNTDARWPFVDVLPRDWFYDYVVWAYDNNITTGASPTTFAPGNNVTRGQFATFLYRVAGEPAVSGGHGFSDVPEGRYFTIPVTWAAQTGVTTGVGGTTQFRPNTTITREQLATMLHRYVGGSAPGGALTGFVDSGSVSSWALDGMRWAVHNDIILGSRGRLLPQDNATRAETVAMLYRAFG